MIKIIPAINVISQNEFEKQIKSVENSVDLVQIDIADGKFTHWKNWADAEKIKEIPTTLSYELHLMVENPIQELKKWESLSNVQRIVVHTESFKEINLELFHKLVDFGFEVGFALNPKTSIEKIEFLLPNLEYILFLGVSPGKSGQKFQKKVLEKIKKIKVAFPHIKIEVDGGVNEGTAKNISKAGADILCIGSAIFNENGTPAENLTFFNNLVN
ncbi:MAG: ribulose-phosphate 3-epimerase [Candidatus Magasanikbacteria bacterium]|nr:ribulose-phosphate 3-epimerase [Candidatus Magasanikbacteria bacterium]